MSILFDVKDIHVSYGGNEIVKGVSFSLQEGELCALLGLNGSGKTTMMRGIWRTYSGKRKRVCEWDCAGVDERTNAGEILILHSAGQQPDTRKKCNGYSSDGGEPASTIAGDTGEKIL